MGECLNTFKNWSVWTISHCGVKCILSCIYWWPWQGNKYVLIFTVDHGQTRNIYFESWTEKLGCKNLLRSIARESIEKGCWSWGHKTSYDIFCLMIFSVNNGKKKTRLQASSSQYNQGVRRRRREERWRGTRWRSSSRSWTCDCARWCTWWMEYSNTILKKRGWRLSSRSWTCGCAG